MFNGLNLKVKIMIHKKIITPVFLLFFVAFSFSQITTRRQQKENIKQERVSQIIQLVNSKEFKFVARRAFPQGYQSIDLSTNNNYIEFKPDFITSEMPFFGVGYSGIGYGRDKGLSFEGKPIEYSIIKVKEVFELIARVKGDQDFYRISLSIFSKGNATLTISCNNRSSISYQGEISKIVVNKSN